MDETQMVQLVEGLFLFALTWSAGCTADGPARMRFDSFLRQLVSGAIPEGCVWLLLLLQGIWCLGS